MAMAAVKSLGLVRISPLQMRGGKKRKVEPWKNKLSDRLFGIVDFCTIRTETQVNDYFFQHEAGKDTIRDATKLKPFSLVRISRI